MKLVRDFFIYIVGISLIGIFHNQEILLLVLLIVVAGIYFKKFWNKHDFVLFLVGFLLGPVADMVAIPFGAWEYANHLYFIFPLWLPVALGLMVVLLKRIAFQISEHVK